jgi:glutamate--cysteine ligase
MQTIAGVHFNFSMPAAFWQALEEREGGAQPQAARKSAAFMGLVRNYRRAAWLTAYLFGASPALSKSFKPEGHELLEELDEATWYAPFATSLRMSDLGYRNKTQGALRIGVNSLDEYVAGLKAAVTTVEPRFAQIGVAVGGEYRQLNANILQIENEYYSAIRPKPSKSSASRPVVALRERGIEYVEVRTLDLNPADPVGINQNELRFVEALLVRCLLADSPQITPAEQHEIDARDLAVARSGRRPGALVPHGGGEVPLREAGLRLMEGIEAVAEILDAAGEGYVAAVEQQRAALLEPERTPSAAVLRDLQERRATFIDYTLGLAASHRDYFLRLPLSAAREEELARVAAQSLEAAAALERDRSEPFEAYLRAHVDAV